MSNTDKLLNGYQLSDSNHSPNKEIPQAGDNRLAEGESYTISDQPNQLVCRLFNFLKFFEKEHPTAIGKIYILAATVIFTLIFWVKQQFLAELPAIEVLFVAFLTTFIFNYFLINGALYRPFIDNEQSSSLIKMNGIFAVSAIASFFYGLKYINLQGALAVFYTSFLLVILYEKMFLNQSIESKELLFGAGALAGVFITISKSSGTFWDQATVAEEGNFFYGVLFSGISAVLMALIMVNFGKMARENFATLNHIFVMMIVLFVPIFFPIQGVKTPTLNQWGILIAIGILTAFACLFFIRSFQLQTGGRSAIFLCLLVAFVYLVELVMGKASGFLGLVGAALTINCVGFYSRSIPEKDLIHEEQEIKQQEMVHLSH